MTSCQGAARMRLIQEWSGPRVTPVQGVPQMMGHIPEEMSTEGRARGW